MKVLKEMLLESGDIDKYFDEVFPVNLWRAKKAKSPDHVFQLVEEKIIRPNGKVRPPDITIEVRNGVKWVTVKNRPRGVSTFNKPNVFKRGAWEYYKIPKGTEIPPGLAVVEDGFNVALGAKHYTIAPAHDMPLDQFKRLLNDLAKLLVKESA